MHEVMKHRLAHPTPQELLSDAAWIHRIAPVAPQYWAMRATRDIMVDGKSAGSVVLPVAVLAVFTIGLAVVAVRRLRFDDARGGWA